MAEESVSVLEEDDTDLNTAVIESLRPKKRSLKVEEVPVAEVEEVPVAEVEPFELNINPVILTPEVVDDFRSNYENAPEALAQDLVRTMRVDFADQIKKDPNFLTYEGLRNGTAGILDYLPSTKGKSKIDRRYTDDQIAILFSNAEPATFMRPFLSEFAKSAPSTEAMVATARLVGPRLIPAATAAGAPAGPVGAATGFVLGTLGTGALSLFTGGLAYLAGDYIEEQIMGADPVITPGQRSSYEAYRTLGGAFGGIRFPWAMSTKSNVAGRQMIQNIKNDAAKRRALKLVGGLDKIIIAGGTSARFNPVLTTIGETGANLGASFGAKQADLQYPGQTGPRLVGEFLGGNLLYATILKALPKMITADTAQIGDGYASNKQQKLFDRVNELYADYGTPEQYDTLIENLTSPEMKALLQESFPNVDFTAAQQGGDPLIMGIEAVKAEGERGLDVARKVAERESYEFMNTFIKGLISNGDPDSLKSAAKLRKSVFDDVLSNSLNAKIAKFVDANEKLSKQPGQETYKTQEEMSEGIYKLVEDFIDASGNKEKYFWDQVPNIEVVAPLSPNTDFKSLPKFLQVFEEISYVDPAVQDNFSKTAPTLFKFIENSRLELGLKPMSKFSDAEINSLSSAREELNTVISKLAGFNAETKIQSLLEAANELPLSERTLFFRNREAEVRERILELNEFRPDPKLKKSEQRLAGALSKAGDYAAIQLATETRAANRAGEASKDVSGITAQRLSEVRSKLLRQARSLAADPATSDEARRIGLMAEAISDDLDVDGFGSAYNVARAFTRAKHDVFSRTVLGLIDSTQKSGAGRLPPEVTFQTLIKNNPGMTLNRVRQLQGMAEFADQQNLNMFLPEGAVQPDQPVFTTTTNLVDGYLRGLKQVASKEIFDPKTGTYKTVIDAQRLETWKTDNAKLLEVFPDLTIDLKSAASAQRAIEVFEQFEKKSRAIERSQKELSKLLDGVSPTVVVANAFESDNPTAAFRNLFALRRMGAPNINTRRTGAFLAGRTGTINALKAARTAELKSAGLTTDEVNEGLRTAVLEHAYLAAGGEGSFNPQVFYQSLFAPLPKDPKKSLMDLANEFNVFPEKLQKRIKFMSEQMMRVQAADAAGRIRDPDAFAAEAGPIVNFYLGVLGSAGGSAAFSAAGGRGPGAISASNAGAVQLRKFMQDLPAVSKLRAIDMIFTDPQLTAAVMQRPKTDVARGRQFQKVLNILNDKLFNTAVSMAPFVVREGFEEEDRGTGSPLAEDPALEIPALERRLKQQIQKVAPANNQQGSLMPAQRAPTPSAGTAPLSIQQASAAPGPSIQNSGPVDRERFAALFPNDSTTQLMKSGIGSLA